MFPDDQELVPAVTSPGGTAETTGRWVVTFADEDEADLEATLRGAGVSHVASSRDFAEQALDVGQAQAGDAVVLDGAWCGSCLGGTSSSDRDAGAAAPGAIVSVEPEYVHHILPLPGSDYLRGYQDGVTDLSGRLLASTRADLAAAEVAQVFQDTPQFTWGLQASGVSSSPFTGEGIKVAVLDTGFTFNHPDFAGRNITAQSFVPGVATADDGHGHGTHCVGTACGPKAPASGVRRYGLRLRGRHLRRGGCSAIRGQVRIPAFWRVSTGRWPIAPR
jgi:subtilisin family serine protease